MTPDDVRQLEKTTAKELERLVDLYYCVDEETERSELLRFIRNVNVTGTAKYNALMNTRSENGFTALHTAATRGDAEVLRYMLRSLSNDQLDNILMLQSFRGMTAVHCAAMCGHFEALKVMIDRPELMRQKELVYLKDKEDCTALDYAIGAEHVEIAEFIYKITPVNNTLFRYLVVTVIIGGIIFVGVFFNFYNET